MVPAIIKLLMVKRSVSIPKFIDESSAVPMRMANNTPICVPVNPNCLRYIGIKKNVRLTIKLKILEMVPFSIIALILKKCACSAVTTAYHPFRSNGVHFTHRMHY